MARSEAVDMRHNFRLCLLKIFFRSHSCQRDIKVSFHNHVLFQKFQDLSRRDIAFGHMT